MLEKMHGIAESKFVAFLLSSFVVFLLKANSA